MVMFITGVDTDIHTYVCAYIHTNTHTHKYMVIYVYSINSRTKLYTKYFLDKKIAGQE